MAWWDDIASGVGNFIGGLLPKETTPPEWSEYVPDPQEEEQLRQAEQDQAYQDLQNSSDVGVRNWQTELADWREGNIDYPPEEMPGRLRDASLITQDEYDFSKRLDWRDARRLGLRDGGGVYMKPDTFWENVETAILPKKFNYEPRWPDVNFQFRPGRIFLGDSRPQVAQHELRHARYSQGIAPEEREQFSRDYFENANDLVLPSGETFPEMYQRRWNYTDPALEADEAYAELANLLRGRAIPSWLQRYYGYMPEWSGQYRR